MAQSRLEQSAQSRLEAQRRWSARPFANYRVTVRNDCRMSWVALMTVARLFEISEGLEQITPCYVASQTCSCYQVRVGEIAYDRSLATYAQSPTVARSTRTCYTPNIGSASCKPGDCPNAGQSTCWCASR
ncbi:MAG: hypothetical protein ABIV47_19250 [Roseiflexaceae bacterium]